MMEKIIKILLLFSIVPGLAACAPAVTVAPPTATVEPSPEPVPTLDLPALDSPQVASDLDTLLQMQAVRTVRDEELIRKWHIHPVVVWNEQARYWVSYYGLDPVVASRVYAMTSVAQQRAMDAFAPVDAGLALRRPEILSDRIDPVSVPVDPFESAVLIGATEPVFHYLFPDTPKEIKVSFDEARETLKESGNILPGDLAVAEAFGEEFGNEVIAERLDDGSANARDYDPLPVGEGIWRVDPFRTTPEQPGWGKVTPWLMMSPNEFRAPPPPEFGSPAYLSALEEVRHQQEINTQSQMAIAQKWADKRFTDTPPGHWNAIAADLIRKYDLSERDAAHALSSLNMAQMDAGIGCWDSKFYYLIIRPWQADPNIAGLVGYPNHPSYPSGHSCFSGAAEEVLSYFFPGDEEDLSQMAEEASISRLYGGIHYRFDLVAGLELGKQVGNLAVKLAKTQNWTSFAP